MEYEIIGKPFPVVVCELKQGEKMLCDSGAMSWMDPVMEMGTTSNGGFGKVMGRMFSGETVFLNTYTAKADGKIAFVSSFPGDIKQYDIAPGKELIIQKSAFLACEENVVTQLHFNKKAKTGLFGGEGFIMNKLSGEGKVFVEIDGSTVEYELAEGQELIVNTGNVAVMDATCTMTTQTVSGLKNKFFGGEGWFNTIVTGPGKVLLQTMPVSSVAATLAGYLPNNDGR